MTRRKLEKSILMHGGNISLVTSVIVLVAFAAGLLVGTLVIAKAYGAEKGFSLVAPMTGSFADGWKAARAKLISTNPMMGNVFSFSGQATAINGKEISFTTSLVNPLDDESLKTRIAVVDDKTKINVWKLKSAEQSAKDREEAQADLNTLQKQREALSVKMSACDREMMGLAVVPAMNVEENADCKDARAKFDANMKAMNDANQKMDAYQKIDNAGLNDIKAGWNVSIMSRAIEAGDNKENQMMMAPLYENISDKQKFSASLIEAREVNVQPVSEPAIPASVVPIK